MAAPPTCSTCGSVLLTEWSKELNSLVYFCTQCRARREEEIARLKVKEEVAEMEVVREAA
jgi:hypothetical protein